MSRYYSKYFICIDTLKPHNQLMRWVLLLTTFYR